jgi:hypothetical protein
MGSGSDESIYWSSPVVTTNNYYNIADIDNLQTLHTNLLSLSPLLFIIPFLAMDL